MEPTDTTAANGGNTTTLFETTPSSNNTVTLFNTTEDTTPPQILLFFGVAIAVAITAKIISLTTRYYVERAAFKAKKKKKEEDDLNIEMPKMELKIPINKKLSTAGGGLLNLLRVASSPGSPEIGRKMFEDYVEPLDTVYENQVPSETSGNEKEKEMPEISSTSKQDEPSIILVQPRAKQKQNLVFENEAALKSNISGEEIRLVQPPGRKDKLS